MEDMNVKLLTAFLDRFIAMHPGSDERVRIKWDEYLGRLEGLGIRRISSKKRLANDEIAVLNPFGMLSGSKKNKWLAMKKDTAMKILTLGLP